MKPFYESTRLLKDSTAMRCRFEQMEIIMASASHLGLIDSINSAYISRGPTKLDAGSFDISKPYKIHQPYRLNDGLFLSD
jgi:hypothetical protein